MGYDFGSASPLGMRVRQVVFASTLAFCKLGLCPGQDRVRKRGCREEPAAMMGTDQIHRQHRYTSPGITAKTPPSMNYLGVGTPLRS